MDLATRIIHAGSRTDTAYNSVTAPIYQTSTFRFEDVGVHKGFEYSRLGNPTRCALEDLLAELEGGAGAVATASGVAAISLALSLFDGGVGVVCTHDCYGGTARLLGLLHEQKKIRFSFVNLNEPAALEAAKAGGNQILWLETPSNPLLRVVDLAQVIAFAHEAGWMVIADNTFMTPLLQTPISYGADLVVHSTTKYLNGHADVIGGAVIARTAELNRKLQFAAKACGAIAGPFDSWLVLRGIKTLPVRMRCHQENASTVARFLAHHRNVEAVFYPGLESHPGHELASRQQRGFGGMVSLALRGDAAAVRRLLRSTRIFTLAESLGGIESLISHPATMSHAAMPVEQRRIAGITDNVIRLSVGIESAVDLIADLEQALDF
jgi:O-succinylhomoserine (thiol)-lyase